MADEPWKIVATEQNFGTDVVEASKQRPVLVATNPMVGQRTGTYDAPIASGTIADDDVPSVFTGNRRTQVEAMRGTGMEEYDIPAFLRKQVD